MQEIIIPWKDFIYLILLGLFSFAIISFISQPSGLDETNSHTEVYMIGVIDGIRTDDCAYTKLLKSTEKLVQPSYREFVEIKRSCWNEYVIVPWDDRVNIQDQYELFVDAYWPSP